MYKPRPQRLPEAIALAVFWIGGSQAGPLVETLRPKADEQFVIGQAVLLTGKVAEGKEASSFGFEVDRAVIYEGTIPPYTGVWDTGGLAPGKHEVAFRGRIAHSTMRAKSVTVELVAPPANLDVAALCRRERQRWALGVATFENKTGTETGEWLALAFPEFLVAAAAQLNDLPLAARQSVKNLLETQPLWARRPASYDNLKTLAAPERDACTVDGTVEVGAGPESPALPVTVVARVSSSAAAGAPLIVRRVTGKLGDLKDMQVDLARTVLGAMELFKTPEERERIQAPLKADFETVRAMSRALAATLKGKPDEAASCLRQAAEPDRPAAKVAWGQVRLAQQDYAGAVEALEEACKLAANDPATLRTAQMLLLSAGNLGCEHYGADRVAERWRCAKAATALDPSDPLTLAVWMDLVHTMEPTPENFRRMAETGDKVLQAQGTLSATGLTASLLENVIIAHLNLKQDSQASAWLTKAKDQLALEEWLWLRYRVYRKAANREREIVDTGSNLLAFAPPDKIAGVLRELVPLVKALRGEREAHTFLTERGEQVWQRVSAAGNAGDSTRAAEELSRAWAELGDAAKQAEWAAKAAEAK